MSGNWNRTPRKGEKSINAVRSDQEHRVRVEYRDAGRIEGLVMAWAIADAYARRLEKSEAMMSTSGRVRDDVDRVALSNAANAAHEVSMSVAECLLQDFPKSGRVALANAGASLEVVDAAENRAASRRRVLNAAKAAARALGEDDSGA